MTVVCHQNIGHQCSGDESRYLRFQPGAVETSSSSCWRHYDQHSEARWFFVLSVPRRLFGPYLVRYLLIQVPVAIRLLLQPEVTAPRLDPLLPHPCRQSSSLKISLFHLCA